MSGVGQEQAGLASGVVNTAFMMGGAVGPLRSPQSPTRGRRAWPTPARERSRR